MAAFSPVCRGRRHAQTVNGARWASSADMPEHTHIHTSHAHTHTQVNLQLGILSKVDSCPCSILSPGFS
eukprot:4025172-Alexandrium_andersonii.AAC.1